MPEAVRERPGAEIYAFPLSRAQEQLWYEEQRAPGTPLYVIPQLLRLSGQLDVAALERVIAALVRRHEALRTSVAVIGDGPMQCILAPDDAPVPITFADLEALPPAAREKALAALVGEEARRPFELSIAPLWRLIIVRLSADEHALLWIFHHIIVDGWSLGAVLMPELARLYNAEIEGRPIDLPPLPVQFADFAEWQRSYLTPERTEKELDYWRAALAGAPPVLDLPGDRPRPAVRSGAGARVWSAIPASPARRLLAVGQSVGATPFMVALATFALLLERYTGARDIVIGAPSAGRSRPEVEGVIGCFVNTLPVRVRLDGGPSFRDLLARVRAAVLDGMAHDAVPLEEIVRAVVPERSSSYSPLFQVMATLHHAPRAGSGLTGLTLGFVREQDTRTAKADLTLAFLPERDGRGGLEAMIEYSADLFDEPTIQRMHGHLRTLIDAIVAAPDTPIAELPLLAAAEYQQIVHDWNATATAYPRDRSIHQLVREQIARTPDAVALDFPDGRLTYAELGRQASRIARELRALGAPPGAAIGVALPRSAAMVAAMLGVLEAGGAYVPLDPAAPSERQRFVLADAGIRVVITRSRFRSRFSSQAAVLRLDGVGERAERETPGTTLPPAEAAPRPDGDPGEALAYIIYTSGSSGRPKGVAVPHRAVVRLVRDTSYVRLSPEDVVAQLSTPSFDAATFEIWGALLNGARLVGLDRDVLLAPRELGRRIAERGITTMFVATALFDHVARLAPDAFLGVSQVLTGGERVNPRSVAAVLRAGRPARLLHVYGPTESTTFATWHEIGDVADDAVTIPIGRPLSNTTVYLLDAAGRPVPVGVPGEIHLGGDGLALGYVGRPDLTAEHFIPHPFRPGEGERLYRTGDIGRYLPGGAIEFIGRGDEQMKVRGFRIEPGEIEAALREHPTVREAVVAAREERPGDVRLVAYAVLRDGSGERPDALRRFLRTALPDYMCPAVVVLLPALPLTANGKVDRAALPAPVAEPATAGYIAPDNTLQLRLADIWQELLGVARVGVRDDFFELGGHSLLAARMMEQVERATGRRVPLSELFAGATIEHLAEALLGPEGEGTDGPLLIPLRSGGAGTPLFFIHGDVHGGGFYMAGLARHLGEERSVHTFRTIDPAEVSGPFRIETLAERYLDAVRTVQPAGPYLLGGFCNGGLIAFEMARRLEAAGERVDLLAVVHASAGAARFRSLYAAVDRAAAMFGLSEAAHFRARAAALSPIMRARRVLADPRSSAVRVRHRLHGLARAAAGRPVLPIGTTEHGNRVEDAYRQALRAYCPRPYGGTVTLLWPADDALSPGRRDPTAGWSRVAAEAEIVPIPGTHLSCLTAHAAELAAALAARMRRSPR